MRLPKKIKFPGGYKVKIKYRPDSFFNEHNCDAMWTDDYIDTGIIYLNKSHSKKKQFRAFKHEINHAFIDWLFYYTHYVLK